MSFEEFVSTYQPIVNPFNAKAQIDGCLLSEDIAEERQLIESVDPECLWTVVECGEDKPCYREEEGLEYVLTGEILLCAGLYGKPRRGFLVTKGKVPYEIDLHIRMPAIPT